MINILRDYPQPTQPRYIKKNFRSFSDKLIANHKDERFYNGSRSTGYGGYRDDGRWKKVALNCIQDYNLIDDSNFLHVNCDYGFLLSEVKKINPNINVFGSEYSEYAYKNINFSIKDNVKLMDPREISFGDVKFDLIIALSVVYTFNIYDAILFLKKLNNLSKNNKIFITLATYNTKEEFDLFNSWTLLGNLCLKKEEWYEIFAEANYKGDYLFIDSNYLSLKFK